MLECLEGRMWHGDHLVDAATAGDVARLLAVQDGTETDGGLVYRVHEFTTAVEGAVVVNGFDRQLPRKAPVDAPLRQLADATKVEVERVGPATVLVASIAGPDSAEDSDELFRELFRQSGVVLATVRWGDVATWVPAEPSRGAPAAAVGSAFLLALAPHERVVPSLAAARSRLAEEGGAPGGERGQRLRESGQTWPSVPTVDSWEDEASDPWVLAALLESAMSPRGESRSTIYSPPVPRMTPLVPGGAPVLVAPAGIDRFRSRCARRCAHPLGGKGRRRADGRCGGASLHGRDARGRAPALAEPAGDRLSRRMARRGDGARG